MNKTQQNILWFNAAIISLVLILLPFHAFTVTVAGYFLSYKEVFSAWKEVLVLLLAFSSFYIWLKNKKTLPFDIVNICVLIIIGLSLAISLINRDWHVAMLIGLKTNIVPLVLFLCAQIAANLFNDKKLKQLILIPAALVTVIALLQPFIFSPNFLQSIGYGSPSANGVILAGQYIESSANTIRAFSTLGGPNQLGAYLLVPTLITAAFFISKRNWKYLVLTLFFTAGVFVSYSRSAWIGLVCGILVLIGLKLPKKVRIASFGIVSVFIGLVLLLLLLPNRCIVSNVLPKSLIHGSCESGQLAGSDQQRIESQKAGFKAIIARPLGYGLGSAGPASFYNQKPLITESWYLQIAIETGIIGLILYIVLFVALARDFLLRSISNTSNNVWPSAMLAVLVSISVAALFLHTWTDSTLALVAMSLFGIVKAKKL
jgi:O-antigen ligase